MEALAQTTPAQRGFLEGARALYYAEQTELGEVATAMGVGRIFAGGEAT